MIIDAPHEPVIQQLLSNLQKDARQLGVNRCFAFLDRAQGLGGLAQRLDANISALPQAWLYRDYYSGSGIEQVDPLLLELPVDEPDTLSQLIELCVGQPMLSVISTPYILAALQTHLREQLEAVDEDGVSYLLRWADTRCLPNLYRGLDAEQQTRVLNGIQGWYFFQRDGMLDNLGAGSIPALPVTDRKPLAFSPSQMQALRASAEADEYLGAIRRNLAYGGKLTGSPAQCHHVVHMALWETGSEHHAAERMRLVITRLKQAGLITL